MLHSIFSFDHFLEVRIETRGGRYHAVVVTSMTAAVGGLRATVCPKKKKDIYSSRVVTSVPANKHKALQSVMGRQTRTIYWNFLFKRKERSVPTGLMWPSNVFGSFAIDAGGSFYFASFMKSSVDSNF